MYCCCSQLAERVDTVVEYCKLYCGTGVVVVNGGNRKVNRLDADVRRQTSHDRTGCSDADYQREKACS